MSEPAVVITAVVNEVSGGNAVVNKVGNDDRGTRSSGDAASATKPGHTRAGPADKAGRERAAEKGQRSRPGHSTSRRHGRPGRPDPFRAGGSYVVNGAGRDGGLRGRPLARGPAAQTPVPGAQREARTEPGRPDGRVDDLLGPRDRSPRRQRRHVAVRPTAERLVEQPRTDGERTAAWRRARRRGSSTTWTVAGSWVVADLASCVDARRWTARPQAGTRRLWPDGHGGRLGGR